MCVGSWPGWPTMAAVGRPCRSSGSAYNADGLALGGESTFGVVAAPHSGHL
jgi:hypothetical protein